MTIDVTPELVKELNKNNISTILRVGTRLPHDIILEPYCSLKNMSIHHSLKMGAFSYAVSGFYFACEIGRYCSFGEQIQIGRHPHPMSWLSTSPFFYQDSKIILDLPPSEEFNLNPYEDFSRKTRPTILKKTQIGNDVWIGHGAFILPGVKIGDGAVIAAMSVVTKDVPSYAVVGGSPAKVIRCRFSDSLVEKLIQLEWWKFAPWQLKGIALDNIEQAIEKILALKEGGLVPYKPHLIHIDDMAMRLANQNPK